MGGPHRRRHVLRAGHGQPAVRHGAQPGRPAARRGDTARTSDLNWDAPFRNLGGTVQINNPYVLANIFDRRTPYSFQYLLNVQREFGERHGGRDRLSRFNQPQARVAARLQRVDPGRHRLRCSSARPTRSSAASRRSTAAARRTTTRSAVKVQRRFSDGLSLPARLHLVALDRQRERNPQPRRRHALPAEQLQPGGGDVAFELQHRPPLRHVGSLRAARSARGGNS